jgi:rhomboid family GlyGly-CTERM serine protease
VARQSAEHIKSAAFLPFFLVVASCTMAYLLPGLSDLLVYDRRAILSGEFWRLLTGHLVHFSKGHLFFNLLGFVMTGWTVWRLRYPGFWMLCVIASLAISGALLLQSDVIFFGGISGIVNAAIVFIAIRGLKKREGWMWLSVVVLILTVANSVLEVKTGQPTLGILGDRPFVPVPLSHLVGGLVGAIMGTELWRLPIKLPRRPLCLRHLYSWTSK